MLLWLVYSIGVFCARLVQWYLFLGRRLGKRYFGNGDTWFFLNEARKIRKGNFRLSSKFREDKIEPTNYVAFALRNHYPPLFIYLLAVIPEKCMDYVIRYSVPFVDAFMASTLFSSISFITGSLEYGMLGVVAYLSSPTIFQHNFSACVRPLALLLVSVIYVVSCSFSVISFLGLSMLIAMTLLLHKFAAQVVVFTSLAFLFIGRPDYLLSVVAGFLIAMIASRGYYLKVLSAHMSHLRTNYLKEWAKKSARSPLKRTAALVVYFPWLAFFAISIYILGWNAFSTILVCTSVWIITLIIFSIITDFPVLRNIGEGWRYLGYSVFPMAFYAIYVIGYSPVLSWTYMAITFLGFMISYYYVLRLYRAQEKYVIDNEDTETLKKASSIAGNEIIAYPDEFTLAAAYFSEKDNAVDLRFADAVVINKELTEEALPKMIEEKGYLRRFEEKRWIVYAR
jgi:hypothetical protein